MQIHVSGVVIVCPISSKLKKYIGDVILSPDKNNKLTKASEVIVGQIRTIDCACIQKKLGSITDLQLRNILIGFDIVCNR